MSKINTWWRVGVTVPMTEEQVKSLPDMNVDEFKKIVEDGLKSKEVYFNGECYMPFECWADALSETDIEDVDEYLEDYDDEIQFDL